MRLDLRPRGMSRRPTSACVSCQRTLRSVYALLRRSTRRSCVVAAAAARDRAWLPTLVLIWLKPWLDRTILFVLSRAAFGQRHALRHLWRRAAPGRGGTAARTLTIRRLSPWRSFTQPVLSARRPASASVRRSASHASCGAASRRGAADDAAFATAESASGVGLLSLLRGWCRADEQAPDGSTLLFEAARATIAAGVGVATRSWSRSSSRSTSPPVSRCT